MDLPPTHADLQEQLLALGVSDAAQVILGVRPSVLRMLPRFWLTGCELLVVESELATLFAVSTSYRSVKQMLATAPVSATVCQERALGRQMAVTWPDGNRIVLDGRANVARARAALGREA